MTTWFVKDTAVNGFGSLSETNPGASTITTSGWTVGKIANTVPFSALLYATKRATGTFSATDYLVTTHPNPGSGDSWRTENTYNGSFASANWTFTFAMRCSVASTQLGRVKFRLWRSTNASGASATEITSATQSCGIIAAISTSANNNTALTFNPGAITLTNEYLFVQVEWNITTAGNSNTADILFRAGDSTIVSSTFTPGTQALTQSAIFTNSQTFPAATVASTYPLTPNLVTNTQGFFTQTVASTYSLTAPLKPTENAFFQQTIANVNQPLTQTAIFTNTQNFLTPHTVATTYALTPSLYTNTNTFFSPTMGISLLPSLFNNSQAPFQPTVTQIGAQDIAPPLVLSANNFLLADPYFFLPDFVETGAVTQQLTPALFSNTINFFTPTITTGTVNVAPSLYTNTNTIFSHLVSTGEIIILPNLYTNTQTFNAHTISVGAVDLRPQLYTNTQTFFSATVASTYALTPTLYTNTQTFFSATVASTKALTPALYTNSQSFFTPTVLSTKALTPGLYPNTNTFFNATVAATYALTPQLFTNNQAYFNQTVSSSKPLTPTLYTNTNSFFTHTVSAGAVNLQPQLYVNTNVFFGGTVTRAGAAATGRSLNNPFIASVGAMMVR